MSRIGFLIRFSDRVRLEIWSFKPGNSSISARNAMPWNSLPLLALSKSTIVQAGKQAAPFCLATGVDGGVVGVAGVWMVLSMWQHSSLQSLCAPYRPPTRTRITSRYPPYSIVGMDAALTSSNRWNIKGSPLKFIRPFALLFALSSFRSVLVIQSTSTVWKWFNNCQ